MNQPCCFLTSQSKRYQHKETTLLLRGLGFPNFRERTLLLRLNEASYSSHVQAYSARLAAAAGVGVGVEFEAKVLRYLALSSFFKTQQNAS